MHASPTAAPAATSGGRSPLALYALTVGAFGIGTTEFVIMGLLLQLAGDLQVSLATAGLLISGYALGVFVGAPLLTAATSRVPRKTALLALMAIFTLGNLACALAPSYAVLMVARVITSLAHGTFFGVGAVVATSVVPADRKASAISTMFTGLTVATLLGVPAGAWLGLHHGWRSTFWAVSAIGLVAMAVIAVFVSAKEAGAGSAVSLREEFKVLKRLHVLLGLAATVLGFAGVFLVFTYVQPLLTRVSGFDEAGVSAILLVFGVGMIVGNIVGGRLADKAPVPTLLGSLAALAVVLVGMGFAMQSPVAAVFFIGLLGGGRLRHRRAAAAACAEQGRRRGPEHGVQPQHRRVQPRQRARRLAGRRRHRPRAGSCAAAVGRRGADGGRAGRRVAERAAGPPCAGRNPRIRGRDCRVPVTRSRLA